MASCAYCSSTIFFGGKKNGVLRFCNGECEQKGILSLYANELPQEQVTQHVFEVHRGKCPSCQDSGPVDLHTSYRVYSALLFTSWSSRPTICCKRCGTKNKINDLLFSFFLGWWGFPWGIVMTPIQITRNIASIFFTPDPSNPSKGLERLLRLHLAAKIANNEVSGSPRV
jgi:hypothetical protein